MIVAIIQARMGSTRLPGKVLKDICGKPMLWHQIQRVKLAKLVDKIVIATTDRPEDGQIARLASEAGVDCFVGNGEDVLDRYYQAAMQFEATAIVRLTGDCPLTDPSVVDRLVDYFTSHADQIEYVAVGPDWPEGLGVEVFSFDALEQAWREATQQFEREHVTTHIRVGGKFKLHHIPYGEDLPRIRVTVDEPKDFEVVSAIFDELYPKHGHTFGLSEVAELFHRQPEIFRHNMDVQRTLWFLRSLQANRKLLRHDSRSATKESAALWERGRRLIPSGIQTQNKGTDQYFTGTTPKYVRRAQGCRVWDVDGNEYIDYPMGRGSVILGHHYPKVDEAIREQLDQGISFSRTHPLEVELAELLLSTIPWAEMIRFGRHGSAATTDAVRAARAYTGNEIILVCNNHGNNQGWYDRSIAGLQFGFNYNDLGSVERLFGQHRDQIAAVIMEPCSLSLPDEGILEAIRELAEANRALLIFDEVLTGFRWRLGGMHLDLGVIPDIVCFGDSLANGLPMSVTAGPKGIMRVFDEGDYASGSGGEYLSLAASMATIQEIRDQDVPSHLRQVGTRLQEGYNQLAWDLGIQDYTRCAGPAPCSSLVFEGRQENDSLAMKSLFQQEILKRGILFDGVHSFSFSHTDADIGMTLGAYCDALEILKRAIDAGDFGKLPGDRTTRPLAQFGY